MKKMFKAVLVTAVCALGFVNSVMAAASEDFKGFSVSAEEIGAAVSAGGGERAGELLAALFSGASRAPGRSPVPVYIHSIAQAAPAPKAIRLAKRRKAVSVPAPAELADVSRTADDVKADKTDDGKDEDGGDAKPGKPEHSETYINAAARAGAFRGDAGANLGGEVLGGGIGIMLVLLLICLL